MFAILVSDVVVPDVVVDAPSKSRGVTEHGATTVVAADATAA